MAEINEKSCHVFQTGDSSAGIRGNSWNLTGDGFSFYDIDDQDEFRRHIQQAFMVLTNDTSIKVLFDSEIQKEPTP
jgi:hypothetical protein